MENGNFNSNINLDEGANRGINAASSLKKNMRKKGAVLAAVSAFLGSLVEFVPTVITPFLENVFQIEPTSDMLTGIVDILTVASSLIALAIFALFSLTRNSMSDKIIFTFSDIFAMAVSRTFSIAFFGTQYLMLGMKIFHSFDFISFTYFGMVSSLIVAPIAAAVTFVVVSKLYDSSRKESAVQPSEDPTSYEG